MAKKKTPKSRASNWSEQLKDLIEYAPDSGEAETLQKRVRQSLLQSLIDRSKELQSVIAAVDPVRMPATVFDPADPETVGRLVAMALLSQPTVQLGRLEPFYGSGVYAVYYRGSFDAYAPISGKEHPIYVGKANPAHAKAPGPREQGEKLIHRLREHSKNIEKVQNLELDDFECRYLVVASGWQEAAERHLIEVYRPIWNSECGICYGLGKHGDSADTRRNGRSPWDTMHPGRSWADKTAGDQVPAPTIRQNLDTHFREYPPLSTVEEALDSLLQQVRQ